VVMVAAAVLGYAMRLFGLSIIASIVAVAPAGQLGSALLKTKPITGGDVSLILAPNFLGLSAVPVGRFGPRRGRSETADAAPGQG
jgi:hypothetical protein